MAKLSELQPEKFEKRRFARDLHAVLAARLLRAKSAVPTLAEFANCSDDQPCRLEGCPMCVRQFRRALMRETHRHSLDQEAWTAASIFPAEWKAADGDLAAVNLGELAGQATSWIDSSEAHDRLLIGGIEVVYVANEGDPLPGFWQLHLNLMIEGHLDPVVQAELGSAFPAPGRGSNVALGEISPEHFHNALTACYKSRFSRRLFSRESSSSPVAAPRRNHRDTALPLAQQLELSEWLLTQPVGSRLILRNIHRVERRDMKLRFKLDKRVV